MNHENPASLKVRCVIWLAVFLLSAVFALGAWKGIELLRAAPHTLNQ